MSFRSLKDGRRFRAPFVALLVATLAPIAVPAAASASPASARSSYQRADRATIAAATKLAACKGKAVTVPVRCASLNRNLQSAGRQLSAAQLRLGGTARASASSAASSRLNAPKLSVKGQTLTWTKVADVTNYLLVTHTPGKTDVYTVVRGTTATPAAAPGKALTFNVRTSIQGSKWSATASIAYPDADAARKAAPVMTVDGTTIRWAKVADVTTYQFVTKVAGQDDKYENVTGTSFTPPAQPGKTARYGLRAYVDGSAWAQEVTVTYPASGTGTTTSSSPTPVTTTPASGATPPSTGTGSAPATPTPVSNGSAGTPGGFQTGIVSGSAIDWQLGFIKPLGARHVRMEFDIDTSVDTMAPIIDHYAAAGVQPLLLATFNSRTPTTAEAQHLATWAAAFGPDGTFWAGKNYPASVQVADIEFGNETNNPYQYGEANLSNWPTATSFITRAKAYAQAVKVASQSVKAANPHVGILAIGDQYAGYTTWVDAMFQAVPNLGDYVDGWTVHPYGPDWKTPIDGMIAATRAHGAADIPVYATEFGIATDNGRCLSDNFGWNKCMTYSQAATTLDSAISGMRTRYGSRLRALYLYSTSDLSATGQSTDRESYFGALENDKTPKGAYTTEIQSLLGASA